MWADNLETEMVIIRDLVEDYPYVAMVRPVWGSLRIDDTAVMVEILVALP